MFKQLRLNVKIRTSLTLAVTLFIGSTFAGGGAGMHKRIPSKFKTKKAYKNIENLNKEYSNKDGFLIVTTNDLTHQLKSLQRYISHKKINRKFNIFLATESDYANPKDPEYKKLLSKMPFYGHARANAIISFLKKKYEKLNLKYVLFIGYAHPEFGDVPMIKLNPSEENIKSCNYGHSGNNSESSEAEFKNPSEENIKSCNYGHSGNNSESSEAEFKNPGGAPTDYPYVDLSSNYDWNNDGYFRTSSEFRKKNSQTTREPEVFVGRIPYYGEESKYGKAADTDIILERFIRYDNEKDIAWRYNSLMLEVNPKFIDQKKFYDEHGFNYELVQRFKFDPIGMRGILNSKGKEISNWQQVQSFPVAIKNTHSHGGAMGMEGFSSGTISNGTADDTYPTIYTLGACSIGTIEHPQNLIYTLLRFQSVAASGGTRSVTNYGGNSRYVKENKLGKSDQLFAGKSVGEAHWGWYGGLFKHSAPSGTASLINIYGDPSVIPFRYGPNPPFPFFVDKGEGFFTSFEKVADLTETKKLIISNKDRAKTAVKISINKPWLKASTRSFVLSKGQKKEVAFKIDRSRFEFDKEKHFEEAIITLTADNGFKTRRRYVLKHMTSRLTSFFDFEKLKAHNVENIADEGGVFTSGSLMKHFKFSKSQKAGNDVNHTKLKKFVTGKELPIVPGKNGNGYSLKHFRTCTNILPIEGDDYSLGFWIRFDSKSRGENEKPFLSTGDSSFSFNITNGKIKGHIKNFTFEGDNIKQFDFGGELVNKNLSKWNHFLVSVNQKQGILQVYQNAQKVAEAKIEKKCNYNFQGLELKETDAIVDNFLFYTKFFDTDGVTALMNNEFIKPNFPKDKQNLIPNKLLKFDIYLGDGIKNPKLVIAENGKKEFKTFPATSSGLIAKNLKENTYYKWFISYGKGKKTEVRSFKTAESVFFEDFETGNKLFDSRLASINKKGGLEGQNALKLSKPDQPVIYEVKNAYEPEKGYRLSMLTSMLRTVRLSVKAYVKDNGKEILLGQVTSPSNANKLILQFKTGKNKYANSSIFLKFTNLSYLDKAHKKYGWAHSNIDFLSMVKCEAREMNLPPKVLIDLDKFRPKFQQGVDGMHVVLTDIVKDPEGSGVRFSLTSGPDWVGIQGDALFSNFGPGNDLGEHQFTISARDNKGNVTEFTIIANAVK